VTSDTSERGLEAIIVASMTAAGPPGGGARGIAEDSPEWDGGDSGGWLAGDPHDYDREYCVDLVQLSAFLLETQPEVAEALALDADGPTRRAFLARLQGEITKHGTIKVLREGIKHGPHQVDLFFGTPSAGNPRAQERYGQNRFSVTRQLRYSRDETQRSLDLGLFINGLPIATFELKNSLTKQTVRDAIEQYQRDRDPREKLFEFGRCVVHFAVDDKEIWFCTHLRGKASWFLPFNQGWNDGAGNPPNPKGLMTDYLWRRILTPRGLTNILENYAQVEETKDEKSGRKRSTQIWPRYHQLDVVRRLLADAGAHGAGHRYLIQHSAGSGKSNSIAWLAHQLIGLQRAGDRGGSTDAFDSIIVVTDRRILDKQITDTVRQFAQVRSTVGHARNSTELGELIAQGKKIIISTVQMFPFVLDKVGDEHRDRRFAIIIDEAHSSQGGKASGALSAAVSGEATPDDDIETAEDEINRRVEARKFSPNASYFAFTATPKNKTLEIFGAPEPQSDGSVQHRPFHSYTMKQAIEERFILDVLANYTPVESYYRLVKTIDVDPEFDTKRATKKLRRYVESHDHAIRLKAGIMVDHFHEQVAGLRKIDGEARAMVVTSGIERAIQYFHAISAYLEERKSPYRAIVAFSGEHEYGGEPVTEAKLNGFPSNDIAENIQQDPYRFLVCADKFQTGYDEPLLHTMYVDKVLSGVKAVQTLSRLNRAHPKKHDVFVLDFMNDVDLIEASFAPYYRTTLLADETDPNKLHDLQTELDNHQVYSDEDVDGLVERYLRGEDRDHLDPILDRSVAIYLSELDEDAQVAFKGSAKAFLRTYGFLSSILPYTNAGWEKLSIFLNFLVPKLPAPVEEDFSRGILEAIDMDSYRVEKQAAIAVQLPDDDGELGPVPPGGGGGRVEPELDRLSSIIEGFNGLFGNTEWADADRLARRITDDIAPRAEADPAYRNARRNPDRDNARIELDRAMMRVMTGLMNDDATLFKQFADNESFRHWMTDTIFRLTYDGPAA